MYNPVLPISHEEISYKDYDLIFLYDTNNKFFALLVWWAINHWITTRLSSEFDNSDIQATHIDFRDPLADNIPNTKLLDFITDFLNDF
jgi:hypothetical protein